MQLSSIKQMAITFEKANSRNQSSTGRYIYFQQKNQAGFLQLQPAVQLDGIPDLGNDHKFVELTKGNDYFNENVGQNEYWMLETINEQLKGKFYNNTEIQNIIGIN
jgi:hypothetical protein